jgi:hypothetical protein
MSPYRLPAAVLLGTDSQRGRERTSKRSPI